MRSHDPLIDALGLLRPRISRVALAIVLGSLALGSAVALLAVSAWLITRAWQMPPVLALTVAVVTVRALALSRGIFGYCERLASHDAALRAAGTARERVYARLAGGPIERVMRYQSGRFVTGVGADVDHVADALVRGIIPIGVAAVLACTGTAILAVASPLAALAMAGCLLIGAVIAPWLAASSARQDELVSLRHHAGRDATAAVALEHAAELRVGGRLDDVIDECRARQADWGDSADRAARPAAVASVMPTVVTGVSLLAAMIVAVGLADTVAPTTVAVLMLVPLAALDALSSLPSAAVVLTRARLAAVRLTELAGPEVLADDAAPVVDQRWAVLAAVDLRCAHLPHGTVDPINVRLRRGDRATVTGPSGAGKTMLLMTLAGLIPPREGTVRLDGRLLADMGEAALVRTVAFFAEDAHLFSTTVRDNLLVARGDCTDGELLDALERVGLRRWVDTLPDGLSTVLIHGAQAVSAGQRRRLLLARALLSPADIVLLDEPTEHLDIEDAESVLDALLDSASGLFGADRTVVVATHQRPADGPGLSIRLCADDEAGRGFAQTGHGVTIAG